MYENPYVLQHQRRRDESVPKDFHKQVRLLLVFKMLFYNSRQPVYVVYMSVSNRTGFFTFYVEINHSNFKELKSLYTRLIRILEVDEN